MMGRMGEPCIGTSRLETQTSDIFCEGDISVHENMRPSGRWMWTSRPGALGVIGMHVWESKICSEPEDPDSVPSLYRDQKIPGIEAA